MDLNLHRLRIFLQVVERGSFSAAAQRLYMSQPSVSNQVKRLEASMRATLIDRSGARIRATAEGEVLAQYAHRVLLLTEEASTAIEQVQDLRTGWLRIGGTTTVGTYLLPRLAARFRRDFPGVEYALVVGNSEQVEDALLRGEIGLAVLMGRPSAQQLVSEPVLDDRLLLCCTPDHRLAGSGPLRPQDVAEERFLLREPGSSTRSEQLATLDGWGLGGADTVDIWGAETAKQGMWAGLGITLISEQAVASELKYQRLVELPVEPVTRPRSIVVCHRRDRVLSPAESVFVARLLELDGWPIS